MTDTVPPGPEPGEPATDPKAGPSSQPPAASATAAAGQPNRVVTLDMDMIDRVMITHPGLTREAAQQALDEAGY